MRRGWKRPGRKLVRKWKPEKLESRNSDARGRELEDTLPETQGVECNSQQRVIRGCSWLYYIKNGRVPKFMRHLVCLIRESRICFCIVYSSLIVGCGGGSGISCN